MTTELRSQIWLMYLRKSRQDDPNETVEEVLAKHETILQEWAKRELGYEIPAEYIYREVISGESLEERIEIQKVLARIEDPRVAGILVVEPQRLSRGDLEDCGKLINILRYTSTLVATPMMTYDMENKMERRFFQDELMRGRDYLEYTKEILWRGRVAAIKRGCFISKIPPYGYDKVVIGKDHTLTPNENAPVIQMIFDLYVNQDKTYYQVCTELNKRKIPAPMGGTWKKDTIRHILKNVVYIGQVSYNKIKRSIVVEDGEKVERRCQQPEDVVIIAEGKHPAIIDRELFQRAQDKLDLNPPKKKDYKLLNPFAGLMYCDKCGQAISRHPYKTAGVRLECRSRPKCYKSAKYEEVREAVLAALEQSELPNLQAKLNNGEGNSAAIQKQLLVKLEKQMEKYREQEDKQYELLETGVYTQDLFERRNTALRQKIDECQEQIYQTKSTMPKNIDYAEKIVALQEAIAALKDPEIPVEQTNKLLKSVIEKIQFSVGETGHNYTEVKLKFFMRL